MTQAAEDAADRLDVARLRRDGTLQLDAATAPSAARDALAAADPDAIVDSVSVTAAGVAITAHETVPLQLAVLGAGRSVVLRATASARLRPGYLAPQ